MKTTALLLFAASLCLAETKLGQPLKLSEPVSVAEIGRNPQKYAGKAVQVKGKVTEVCEMAGCWMNLVDPAGDATIRVKVNDGEIVFPKTAIGKLALAEGTLKQMNLTKEQMIAQAKHEAEERGRKFNPASIKSGGTIYQIQGTGAVILD